MAQVPTPTSLRFHGQHVRGIDLSRSSILFEGRFGRMFRALPPAEFGTSDSKSEENLTQLASKVAACPISRWATNATAGASRAPTARARSRTARRAMPWNCAESRARSGRR